MNRIEEIRKKHEESIHDGQFRIFATDVEFLLSRLQIAEEALKEILDIDDRSQAISAHEVAKAALEQIGE